VIEAADNRAQETWRRLGAVVLSEQGPFVEQWLSSNGADAAIIRPDRHAFALTQGSKELEAATKNLANRLFKQ
jgi:3-(3-hydroxy-phenyl)propionate hydroxylase